jgi:hypothetical protein
MSEYVFSFAYMNVYLLQSQLSLKHLQQVGMRSVIHAMMVAYKRD